MSYALYAVNILSNVVVAIAALIVIHHNGNDRNWRFLRLAMLISLIVSAKNILWILTANPIPQLTDTLPNLGFAIVCPWIVWIFLRNRPAIKNELTDRFKTTFLAAHPK